MPGVVHIAGLETQVGDHLRQRCGWCGAVLLDYALDRIAVPAGQDPRPRTWPVGVLVEVDGAWSTLVEHEDGQQLPENACGHLDPAATA
jgi:hypothetical protein